MEAIYLESVKITCAGDKVLELKNVRYSQKGTIMMFQTEDDRMIIVNYDNVLYFSYKEANKVDAK